MLCTVKGLVLRSVKYADYDKLISVLTEEGKLFFKAKGIRSVTSKNAAGCQVFTYSEFVLDSRGDRYFLIKATPLYSTVKAGCDIASYALASYLAELCEDTALDAETGQTALRLLSNALFLISKEDRPTDLIKGVFELRLLAALGFMPFFSRCARCRKEWDEGEEPVYFRFLDGEFLCPACLAYQEQNVVKVTKSVIKLAERSMACKEQEAYAIRVSNDLLAKFSAFSEKFLTAQLDKKYNTLTYYHSMKQLPEVQKKD